MSEIETLAKTYCHKEKCAHYRKRGDVEVCRGPFMIRLGDDGMCRSWRNS